MVDHKGYARYCRALRDLDRLGSAADDPYVGLRGIDVFRHRRSATENPATSNTHSQPAVRTLKRLRNALSYEIGELEENFGEWERLTFYCTAT